MKNEKVNKIFYIVLLLQPTIDLVTSLMTKFIDMPLTLGVLVRGIMFIFGCIYIFFLSKSKYKKISIIYMLLLFVFSVCYFLTKPSIISNKAFLLNEVTYMFKYYYVIVMALSLFNYFDDYRPNMRKIFKIIQINLFAYCFFIVLANVTGTAFGTYQYGGFGNTGWFYSGNEISVIVSILFPFLYLLVNKSNSYNVLLYIIPIVLGIEIIGTKTSMLGLLLATGIFLVYYLIRFKNGKKKQFFMTLIILLVILVSAPNLPVIQNIKNNISIFELRQKNNNLDEDYSDKVVTNLLFSDRDYYQRKVDAIYKRSDMTSKVFGLGFANRKEINDINIEKLIEMDFYDVFYHYGIVGFIIYLIPLIYLTYMVFKFCFDLKFKFNVKQLILMYCFYVGIAIAFLVGHVLGAPAVSLYMAVFAVLMCYYLKNGQYRIDLKENKVTILALHLGIGGVENYISNLCEMLENNYDIEVISTYKIGDKPAFYFSDKIEIRYLINDYPHKEEFYDALKTKNIFRIIKYGFALFKILILKYIRNILCIENIDSKYIITTRTFHNKLVSRNKNRDIISIATEHNYHNNDKKYINRLCDSCDNIDYLVLVSQELKEFYENKFVKTKCIYIPNIIKDIPKYKEKKKVHNKLVAIGRLVPEKGFDDLIDVISILNNKNMKVQLDIYGDGPGKIDLKNKIEKLSLENSIRLCGFLSHDEIMNKLGEYDLYTMTSHTESFGIVLLEAMCNSVPCIAFDTASGARKILGNGIGILVENRDKDKFANEIVSLLNDVKKINRLTSRAYEEVLNYNIDVVRKQWIKLLEGATSNNN